MTKRFMAFLMVLVLGISMLSFPAFAEPVSPDCQHPSKGYDVTYIYESLNTMKHQKTTITVLVCKHCHDELALPVTTVVEQYHNFVWSDWHTSATDTHHFQRVCSYCGFVSDYHALHCTGVPEHVTYPPAGR